MYSVANGTSIGARIHHAIATAVAADVKANDIDIIGIGLPGIVAIVGVDLGRPFGIRHKGNPCISGAIGLD